MRSFSFEIDKEVDVTDEFLFESLSSHISKIKGVCFSFEDIKKWCSEWIENHLKSGSFEEFTDPKKKILRACSEKFFVEIVLLEEIEGDNCTVTFTPTEIAEKEKVYVAFADGLCLPIKRSIQENHEKEIIIENNPINKTDVEKFAQKYLTDSNLQISYKCSSLFDSLRHKLKQEGKAHFITRKNFAGSLLNG